MADGQAAINAAFHEAARGMLPRHLYMLWCRDLRLEVGRSGIVVYSPNEVVDERLRSDSGLRQTVAGIIEALADDVPGGLFIQHEVASEPVARNSHGLLAPGATEAAPLGGPPDCRPLAPRTDHSAFAVATSASFECEYLAQPQPGWTFDSFAESPSNRSALREAAMAARSPSWDPLTTIVGRVGVGKSHLLHAIANHHLAERPRGRTLLVPAASILSSASTETASLRAFAEHLVDADVVLCDDVDLLSDESYAARTVREALLWRARQRRPTILSAREGPRRLQSLPAGLRSAMLEGAVATIEPHDFEIRRTVVERLYAHDEIHGDVLRVVALAVQDGAREVVAVVRQLGERVRFGVGAADRPAMLRMLCERGIVPMPHQIAFRDVVEAVSSATGVKIEALLGDNRSGPVARARHLVAFILHDVLDVTYEEIGRHLGRSRGSVHNAVAAARARLDAGHLVRDVECAIATLRSRLNPLRAGR